MVIKLKDLEVTIDLAQYLEKCAEKWLDEYDMNSDELLYNDKYVGRFSIHDIIEEDTYLQSLMEFFDQSEEYADIKENGRIKVDSIYKYDIMMAYMHEHLKGWLKNERY